MRLGPCRYTFLDDDTIVATTIPASLSSTPPSRPVTPPGPRVQDNSEGKKSQNRTYPDLLKDEHDVALFEYYCTSEVRGLGFRVRRPTDPHVSLPLLPLLPLTGCYAPLLCPAPAPPAPPAASDWSLSCPAPVPPAASDWLLCFPLLPCP